jgi:hypothetical protein
MRQGGEEGEEAKPANGGGDKGNEKPKF